MIFENEIKCFTFYLSPTLCFLKQELLPVLASNLSVRSQSHRAAALKVLCSFQQPALPSPGSGQAAERSDILLRLAQIESQAWPKTPAHCSIRKSFCLFPLLSIVCTVIEPVERCCCVALSIVLSTSAGHLGLMTGCSFPSAVPVPSDVATLCSGKSKR